MAQKMHLTLRIICRRPACIEKGRGCLVNAEATWARSVFSVSLVHAKMPARHIVTSVWAKKWDDCARCGVMIKEKPLLRKCQWQKNIYFSWIWLLSACSLFLSQPTLQSLYSPSGVQNICFGSFSRQPARVQSHHLTTFIGWVGMLWLYFITWKQSQLSINSTPHSVCCCLRSTVIL